MLLYYVDCIVCTVLYTAAPLYCKLYSTTHYCIFLYMSTVCVNVYSYIYYYILYTFCTVLMFCLYCTVQCHTSLYCTILNCTMLYWTVLATVYIILCTTLHVTEPLCCTEGILQSSIHWHTVRIYCKVVYISTLQYYKHAALTVQLQYTAAQ